MAGASQLTPSTETRALPGWVWVGLPGEPRSLLPSPVCDSALVCVDVTHVREASGPKVGSVPTGAEDVTCHPGPDS